MTVSEPLTQTDLSGDAVLRGRRYLDMQRHTLALLEHLTSSVVDPRAAEVDAALHSAEESAEHTLQQRLQQAETARDAMLAAAQGEAEALRQSIQQRFDADSTELKKNYREAKARIDGQTRELINEERRKRNERVLMADTVAPAVVEGHAKDLRRTERTLREQLEHREEIVSRLAQQCQRYGVELPAAPECHDLPPGSNAADLLAQADERALAFAHLRLPRLMSGARPYLLGGLIIAAIAGLAWLPSLLGADLGIQPAIAPAAAGGVSLIVLVLVGRVLARKAQSEAESSALLTLHMLEQVVVAVERDRTAAQARYEHGKAEALEQREQEVRTAEEKLAAIQNQAEAQRSDTTARVEGEFESKRTHLEQQRDARFERAETQVNDKREAARVEFDRACAAARVQHDGHCERARQRWDASQEELQQEWREALAALQALLDESRALNVPDCEGEKFELHAGGGAYVANVPFGWLQVDLERIAERVRVQEEFPIGRNGRLRLPAILPLPVQGSLLVQTQREQRRAAIDLLRAVIVRIMLALPPGQARFTIIDPIGLGENFAGLMHLVDYEEALLDGRIWTEADHIESRLANLTGHMETVIQKYLRNEFETIAAYNVQAGELAEPLRFLVIADYPACFSDTALERLQRIVRSGARCGVFTLIACDPSATSERTPLWDDLREASIHLDYLDDAFRYADAGLRAHILLPETPPSEERLTEVMHAVGRAAKDSLRVEVPFAAVAPSRDDYWSRDTAKDVQVALGRSGAVRLQSFRVGSGLAQHSLIAGKTGSGKSTLLHVLITNLALWYSPDEIELYLIDFKQGVEFKTYVTHRLPHARAVAIESDREFGLSVLQRIDAEMKRRGELFRTAHVQDLAAYRTATGEMLPRVLLIVDEFQVFFSEDDRLAQEAGVLLDQLVRQGRAFGIHVVLGSQSLAGNIALARSTLGQMAVRIALQCSEADAQLILDDTNTAARLLTRPGEAIYNDAGGLVEGNSPFQTAWLPDAQRSELLEPLPAMAKQRGLTPRPLVVFEGNEPADLRDNSLLAEALHAAADDRMPPRAWLGAPVAIKDPSNVIFRRQPGAHLLIVGQQERSAMAVMGAAIVSVAAQRSVEGVRFVVLDGSPEEHADESVFVQLAAALPHTIDRVAYRDVGQRIQELAELVRKRIDSDEHEKSMVLLSIYALQRYRVLRRSEDEFSFSVDENAPPRPDKELALILRDGPAVGIHVVVWSDTLANLERTLERGATSEFDNRLLYQMGQADSSNLIDSPEANRLGPKRALLYSEERGMMEKLRPYAAPEAGWLGEAARLMRRAD